MNDDSLTPEAELASAALDNEVTAAERAQVAGSAALRDELSFYSELRTQLADVPVSAKVRESALAAALGIFDEQAAARAESAPEPVAAGQRVVAAPVVSLHERRQRQYRWLGGAAAAAVVIALGVGVLSNIRNGSEDNSTFSASTEQKSAAVPPEAADQAAGSANTIAASQEAAPAAPAAASEPSGEIEINGPADLDAWVSAPPLETDDDVIAFVNADTFGTDTRVASDSGDAADETAAPDTTVAAAAAPVVTTAAAPGVAGFSDCPRLSAGPLSAAIYQGRKVFVVRDNAAGQIQIVDPTNCELVATVALP